MWTHVKAISGMGLQEQWIMKVGPAPACSLRRNGADWTASLLNTSGISAVALDIDDATLEEAKLACECALSGMGWGVASAT
jgi:hypothetical protein